MSRELRDSVARARLSFEASPQPKASKLARDRGDTAATLWERSRKPIQGAAVGGLGV